MQGDRVSVETQEKKPIPFVASKRGGITSFSQASRLRMLKMVASVNWSAAGKGLFITLTYPDSRAIQSARQRNIDLDRFHDRLERFTDKKIPLLWRAEWKPRKSGRNRGLFVPHFHLITFAGRFVPHEEVRRWWREVLDVRGPLATDVDSISGKKKFAVYIAKYAAKVPETSSLDYPSYPKVDGRHWGTLRRNLIPFAHRTRFEKLDADTIRTLQSIATDSLSYYRDDQDRGFTLLGKNAEKYSAVIEQLALDAGHVPVYDN